MNISILNDLVPKKQWQKLIFFVVLPLFVNSESVAKESPVQLVDWHSSESIERLSRSNHRADFAFLSNEFQNQIDGITCGPTTGAIVLNALRIRRSKGIPKTGFNGEYRKYFKKDYDPRVARYTPASFMTERAQKIKSWMQLYGQPINGRSDFGLQVRQLHKIFLTHGVKSKLRIVDKNLPNQKIKTELITNLGREGDYVVVNYKRSVLGQKGGGHISPLGAYDEETDSFLVMDVNSSKHNWVWVKAEDMISAMRTFNGVENRGYLLIAESR